MPEIHEKEKEQLMKLYTQTMFNMSLVQFNMMAAEYRICKDCGKEFGMLQDEVDFFKKKNLQMPLRCKNCRNLRKTTVATIDNDTLKHGCSPSQGVKNMVNNMVNVGSKTNFQVSAMAEALKKAGKI